MSHYPIDVAALLARMALAYVYLYAAYLNSKPANREWLLTHTALLFPAGTSPSLANAAAFVGMAMMFVGGTSILLGLATWVGCAALIAFTILGFLQHSKEAEFSTKLADTLTVEIDALPASAGTKEIQKHLFDLRVSAFLGQSSSGLKNWGLIGAFVLLAATGSGRYSLDFYLMKYRGVGIIQYVIWPM